MLAFGLTLATFTFFAVVGVALLAVVRAETTSLRVALIAPVLGAATTVLPLFFLSHAGVAIEHCAVPVASVVFVSSVIAIAWRRPRLHPAVVPVIVICVGGLVLSAWPMFRFGFDWIANANDDMANYVLSATQLLHHGLLAPFDAVGLSQDRDYATALQTLHTVGSRPGGDMSIAALARVSGRAPYEVFMPLIFALNLCTVCAAGALAMQASRRWWAASVAALLLVVSPLATYGALQQLLPQVWGLGLAAALLALVMRPEIHQGSGARLRDAIPIGVLVAAIIAVYVELASTLVVAYAIYVVQLVVRRRIDLRAAARLWIAPVVVAVVFLNTYLVTEVHYLSEQAGAGLQGRVSGSPFGFSLVPAALSSITGLEILAPSPATVHLSLWIVVSAVLLLCAGLGCLWDARRGGAASTTLIGFGLIGVLLGIRGTDFGLLKLYMYIQPFLAAAVAVWVSGISKATRKVVPAVVGVVLLLLVAAQLRTQHKYVDASQNPIDLPHASSPTLLPKFRSIEAKADVPVVSVTENPILLKLEAASIGDRRLFFVSAEVLLELVGGYKKNYPAELKRSITRFLQLDGWRQRSFDLHTPGGDTLDPFRDNTHASAILKSGRCVTVVPTGSQLTINRRSLPEGSADLTSLQCGDAHNVLVFTNSSLGENFYFFGSRKAISFYQLEPDYFFPGHTFSGYGRYSLFRVLGPSSPVRLEVSFTTTVRQDGSNLLPPAKVVGSRREGLPLTGRGSARVISAPLQPQMIDGQPFVLLDIGRDGSILSPARTGISGLWAKNVPLDPRYLTSYVRDVSLMSDAQYRSLRAPAVLRHFPADLGNPDLEYSGMYEDGWVAEDSYTMLAAGGPADLVVQANVLPEAKHLEILVNGHRVFSRRVAPGLLDLRIPVSASSSRRRLELRWAAATRLGPKDLRRASALLTTIGFVPRASP